MNANKIIFWSALAVVTAAALLYNFWPERKSAPPPSPAPPTTAAVTNTAPAAATNAPNVTNLEPIDRSFANTRWERWLDIVRLDPFLIRHPMAIAVVTNDSAGPGAERFKLMALWLQTGGRLAVIDNHILGEGEPLEDYRILRIEPDQVVVQREQSPDPKTEFITFTSFVAASQRQAATKSTNWVQELMGSDVQKVHY